jgi:hypothetical protein
MKGVFCAMLCRFFFFRLPSCARSGVLGECAQQHANCIRLQKQNVQKVTADGFCCLFLNSLKRAL